ncbi:GntR family transcriptional regulator [Candidatus Bipolaricaulota bacterium]|nr:GntR family transcriptional regulator [Candidatus Bipolaricaulota bacterium]
MSGSVEMPCPETGVSQATVREALTRLVSDGLAAHVPHRGVKAVTISVEDMRDIYDMRRVREFG